MECMHPAIDSNKTRKRFFFFFFFRFVSCFFFFFFFVHYTNRVLCKLKKQT